MEYKFTKKQIAKFREAWLRDLETTKARQGGARLRTDTGGYCCLGRGCVVLKKMGLRDPSLTEALKHNSFLPPIAEAALGLRSNRGDSIAANLSSCIQLNDTRRLSFKQIAKQLRTYKEYYFKD